MLALLLSVWIGAAVAAPPITCSILVFHRFGPVAADSMTTRTTVMEQQILALRAHGYRLVTLAALIGTLQGRVPPEASLVAITVDDGHRSVYTDLYPLIGRLGVPVTLFIYPSAIGNARYALDWAQLRTLAASPGIEIGSHTYWHPDFRREHQGLAPAAYAALAALQLARPREVLHAKLGVSAPVLAWPYGISDEQLRRQARASGYTAALALGNRNASAGDDLYALPRHLITDAVGVRGLLGRLATGPACVP